jgi:hypothetical protein
VRALLPRKRSLSAAGPSTSLPALAPVATASATSPLSSPRPATAHVGATGVHGHLTVSAHTSPRTRRPVPADASSESHSETSSVAGDSVPSSIPDEAAAAAALALALAGSDGADSAKYDPDTFTDASFADFLASRLNVGHSDDDGSKVSGLPQGLGHAYTHARHPDTRTHARTPPALTHTHTHTHTHTKQAARDTHTHTHTHTHSHKASSMRHTHTHRGTHTHTYMCMV